MGLDQAETTTVAPIEAGVTPLIEGREIIAEFHLIVRRKVEAGLPVDRARPRRSNRLFAGGVATDEAAIRAAITSSCFNGQTEGQITKLDAYPLTDGGDDRDTFRASLTAAIS